MARKEYGTSSKDWKYILTGNRHYFGLKGDDQINVRNLPIVSNVSEITLVAGGSGSDSYAWDGKGSLYIVETGGDNDYFEYDVFFNRHTHYALEVNNSHLVILDDGYNELIFTNYKDPAARIERFDIKDGRFSSPEVQNFDQFISKVMSSEGWLGSYSYEEWGISAEVGQQLEAVITDAITFSHQKERESERRFADKDDVKMICRLYQAAFDRTPDVEGLNHWIDSWEKNTEVSEISTSFYASEEFTSLYGDPTNEQFVSLLYDNVLDRSPDRSGLEYWTSQLNQGKSRSEILVGFSESQENINKTDSVFDSLNSSDGYWLF